MVSFGEHASVVHDSGTVDCGTDHLVDLYIKSLFLDERLNGSSGRHTLSRGVFRLVLDVLSREDDAQN